MRVCVCVSSPPSERAREGEREAIEKTTLQIYEAQAHAPVVPLAPTRFGISSHNDAMFIHTNERRERTDSRALCLADNLLRSIYTQNTFAFRPFLIRPAGTHFPALFPTFSTYLHTIFLMVSLFFRQPTHIQSGH